MRLVSQDKTTDIPYEGVALSIRKPSDEKTSWVFAYSALIGSVELHERKTRPHGLLMARYDTQDEAARALRAVRKAYEMGLDVYELEPKYAE